MIDFGRGHRRVIAELFKIKGGIEFFDVGWYEATFHPQHQVMGTVTGEGPWQIGDEATISVLEEGDELWGNHMLWERFKASEDGKLATRGLARSFVEGVQE